jgi:hypothetical protein
MWKPEHDDNCLLLLKHTVLYTQESSHPIS